MMMMMMTMRFEGLVSFYTCIEGSLRDPLVSIFVLFLAQHSYCSSFV